MTSPSSRKLAWIFGAALAAGCAHEAAKPDKVADVEQKPAPRKAAEPPPADPLPPEKITDAADESAGGDAIYFDFDSALLRDDARDILAKVAGSLKEQPDSKLAIEGNCDALGTVEYNLALGQHRAEAAKAYLVQMGVQRKRIKTASFGSQRPKYPGRDEAAYSKNRRDDLIVK
ncbi:MAG TPA: OmpA family protein [Polyangia bacterium]|nr:OmpA family protein [Polyangia bacterium]